MFIKPVSSQYVSDCANQYIIAKNDVGSYGTDHGWHTFQKHTCHKQHCTSYKPYNHYSVAFFSDFLFYILLVDRHFHFRFFCFDHFDHCFFNTASVFHGTCKAKLFIHEINIRIHDTIDFLCQLTQFLCAVRTVNQMNAIVISLCFGRSKTDDDRMILIIFNDLSHLLFNTFIHCFFNIIAQSGMNTERQFTG